jgi:hypothetical protein
MGIVLIDLRGSRKPITQISKTIHIHSWYGCFDLLFMCD